MRHAEYDCDRCGAETADGHGYHYKGERLCRECAEVRKAYPRNRNDEPNKVYSVWVGGVEVNEYLLSWRDAETLADEYLEQGYDDVGITTSDQTECDGCRDEFRQQTGNRYCPECAEVQDGGDDD